MGWSVRGKKKHFCSNNTKLANYDLPNSTQTRIQTSTTKVVFEWWDQGWTLRPHPSRLFFGEESSGPTRKSRPSPQRSWELGVLGVLSELRTSRMQHLLGDIRGLLALLNLHTGMTIESTKPSPPFSGDKQKHVKVMEGPITASWAHSATLAVSLMCSRGKAAGEFRGPGGFSPQRLSSFNTCENKRLHSQKTASAKGGEAGTEAAAWCKPFQLGPSGCFLSRFCLMAVRRLMVLCSHSHSHLRSV